MNNCPAKLTDPQYKKSRTSSNPPLAQKLPGIYVPVVKHASLSRRYPSTIAVTAMKWFGYLVSKTFWFIKHSGIENIPPGSAGGFLIAANHQTYLDPGWICLPLGRKFRFMAYDKAFEWPVIGSFIRYMGAFPISADVSGSLTAMRDAVSTLTEGAVLIVFPEGEREFADGRMLPFKTGAVRIARHADAPILPVTIIGGDRVWPQGQRYPQIFKRVEVVYHPLFYVKHEPGLDPHQDLALQTSKLKEIIAEPASPSLQVLR